MVLQQELFCLEKTHNGYFNASYGVVPRQVRAYHQNLLDRCEQNPYRWFTRDLQPMLRETRARLAQKEYLDCEDPDDLVLIDNSSSGANSVFKAVSEENGAVVLLLSTAYGLIRNLAEKHFGKSNVVYVDVNLLLTEPTTEAIAKNVAEAVDRLTLLENKKVSLVCLDHVASCPGVVLPVCDIARVCKVRGIPNVFVDGAHALGQIRVSTRELEASGVTHWVTDAHKWFFSPKGSAVMWVRKDKQGVIRPSIDCAAIGSPGCTVLCEETSLSTTPFQRRFGYLGTKDYTPWLAIQGAMDFVETELNGYSCLIERNRQLAVWAQRYLNQKLDSRDLLPTTELTGSMCNVCLPFVKTTQDAEDLMTFLESRGIYTVVYEYQQRFWIRLCIQWFVDKEQIANVTSELINFFNFFFEKKD